MDCGPSESAFLRLVVHLNEDTVGADGNGSARHGQHLVALAGAVAGIDQDGAGGRAAAPPERY